MHYVMDNFYCKFTARGEDALRRLVALVVGDSKATHYSVSKNGGRLTLYWTACPSAKSLPFPVAEKAMADFLWNWLTSSAVYGNQPDLDGSVSKGWTVFATDGTDNSALITVEATWAEHHK